MTNADDVVRRLRNQALPLLNEAADLIDARHRLHAYACSAFAAGKPKCGGWCGRLDRCPSTLTYDDRHMQLAYEHGYRDALEAAAVLCDGLANSTGPQRRAAGEDMAKGIRELIADRPE